MRKSAKTTQNEHGKNIKAKSSFNKSILDQAWYKFRNQLEYKSNWQGGAVIRVEANYQTCSNCGNKTKESRLMQSSFVRVNCSFEINADVNAARNILAAGLCRVGLCSELHWQSTAETSGKARASTNCLISKNPLPLGRGGCQEWYSECGECFYRKNIRCFRK